MSGKGELSCTFLHRKMKEGFKRKDRPFSKGDSSMNVSKEKNFGFNKNELLKEVTKSKKPDVPKFDPNIPDRTYGDYYCQICDSHMNSDGMWEAHITGKRHLKNVKKGDTDSKYEDIDVKSSIEQELKKVTEPVVGLNYIHEIRRREPGVPSSYNCFLCCASIVTVPLVIEHIVGSKHRLNFIKENNPKEYQLIEGAKLTKSQLEPLVAEKTALLESECGRGVVKVKREKIKTDMHYKRSTDDDVEEIPRKSSKLSFNADNRSSSVWKTMDSERKDYTRPKESQRYKSSYYEHDDHADIFEGSYSRRERPKPATDDYHKSYSRSSELDDSSKYSNNYSNRHDDYSKTVSSAFLRRPYVDSYEKHSEEFYRSVEVSSHSKTNHEKGQTATDSPSNPDTQTTDPKNTLKDFVVQLLSLSKEYFLKIILMKLQDMEYEELKRNELDVLMKIYSLSQQIICRNLPPQVQELLKDKFSKSSQPKDIPPSQPVPVQNLTLNDINELLMKARQASGHATSNQPTQQTVGVSVRPSLNMPIQQSNTHTRMENMQSQSDISQPYVNVTSSTNNFASASTFQMANQNTSNVTYSTHAASSIPGLTLTEENPLYREFPVYQSNQFSYKNY